MCLRSFHRILARGRDRRHHQLLMLANLDQRRWPLEPLISKAGQSRPCVGERWWMATPVDNLSKTVRHTDFRDTLTLISRRIFSQPCCNIFVMKGWEPRPYWPGIVDCDVLDCTTCPIKPRRKMLEFGVFPRFFPQPSGCHLDDQNDGLTLPSDFSRSRLLISRK